MQDKIQAQQFSEQIKKYEADVLRRLLITHTDIKPEKFVEVAIKEVKKNQKLLDAFVANPASMFASLLFCAEIGLYPDSEVGEFFLIPRNLKQPDGHYKMTVTPLIGYKGILNILFRSGHIDKIESHVVYEGDEFKVAYGLNPLLEHIPNFKAERTANNIILSYAVATLKNGLTQFAIATKQEIETIMNMSKEVNKLYFNDKSGITRWMERKAALIELSKLLPKDYYSQKAISYEGALEGGSYLSVDENNQIVLINSEPKKIGSRSNIYQNLSQNLDLQRENAENK